MFQLILAHVVCSVLDAHFTESDLISCFNILNPTNMSSRQVGLQNWCIFEFDTLLGHYGVDRSHGSFKLPPLVD